jgi:hypothetical protein
VTNPGPQDPTKTILINLMTRTSRRSRGLAKPWAYARNGGGRAWLPNVPVQG